MFLESAIITVVLLLADSAATPEKVTIPRVCLNGKYNELSECVCNPGFSEYQGNCFQTNVPSSCPPGSVLWNGMCRSTVLPPMQEILPAKQKYTVVPPLRIVLLTPQQLDPLDPTGTEDPAVDDTGSEEDQVDKVPMRDQYFNVTYQKIVNNHNVINNATTHNTENVNNVIVHLTRKKANGLIRTVVIRNNETTVYEEEPRKKGAAKTDGKKDHPEESTTAGPASSESAPPCCTIVSPRVCRKQTDEWVCFHRKQYVCSKHCTAKVMYLNPSKPRFEDPWLVMPPLRNPFARLNLCRSGDCPRPDCSGCLRGRSQCHPMCYTYDCMQDDSCNFIDQEQICKEKPGPACALMEYKVVTPPETKRTEPSE